MRNVEVNKDEKLLGAMGKSISLVPFSLKSLFRKGEVGDHENYLSQEMIECIDKVVKEKLSGSGLNLG
ncbi:hypothetical protein QJS04_geneDACA023313 [Acorus gramineus]|uniref:Sulfotransferase n=1 Tax=Acorus gramineus TaxID=55184 RepID=A0AAV9BE26_ACOGR|nr:hypothetical protein QJS04_geneDACA023313 [Acorus gramineus]